MNGFIVFLIFVFIIIPVIKSIAGAKPTNKLNKGANPGTPNQTTQNWAEVQKLLQQKINDRAGKPIFDQSSDQRNNTRDEHGHSDARKNARQRLRSGSGNQQVFPKDHQARVNKRDQHARSERNRIEAMLHSKNNRSIIQDGNKSIDNWGVRGDRTSGYNFLFLILFGLVALFVLSNFAPQLWGEILESLNIK